VQRLDRAVRLRAASADKRVPDAELVWPEFPLGDSLDVFIRREDAERFIENMRSDDPELAQPLRIEERTLEVGGRN
jgi:hypothetical protein